MTGSDNSVIRSVRQQKRMTLDYLASVTGLSKGYLSKVERADSLPPFSTLELIAKAFDMEVMQLLEKTVADHAHPDIDVMRKAEQSESMIGEASDKCSFTSLLHSYKGRHMTPILVTFEPGAEREFAHDSEEFCYLVSGSLTLVYAGETFGLEAGDCFYLDSRKTHRFTNHHDTRATLLSVSYNYRRF